MDSVPAPETAAAASSVQPAQTDGNAANADLLAAIAPRLDLLPVRASAPAFYVPLEPGRLTPTPLVTAGEEPAAELPEAAPFLSAPVAPSKPTGFRAQFRAQLDQMRHDHLWLGLAAAQSGAATFDAWSTRRVISSGDGHELNPFLKPFAGNASLYFAIQAAPLALDYLGWRMMHSDHQWERRIWWMPQSVSAALSIASGVHNLGVN